MMDLKVLNSALEQLEAERGIPRDKIIEVIEDALAAAYKKDYGKRGQIIKAHFDSQTGKTEFHQVKKVVDESMVRMEEEGEEEEEPREPEEPLAEGEEKKVRFNPEHHILLSDAKKIKKNAVIEDELLFPL